MTLKVVDDGGSGAKAVAAAIQGSRNGYNLISCGSFGEDGLACAPAIARVKALQIPLIAESSLNDHEKYYTALMLARAAAAKAGSIDGPEMASALSEISDASQVPGFIGPKKLYSGDNRFFATGPSDFTFVKAGPTVDGLLVPGK